MSKITSFYRGNQSIVTDDFRHPPFLSDDGSVTFSTGYCGNKKSYRFTIPANMLLITAHKCLEQVSKISGVKFKITYE